MASVVKALVGWMLDLTSWAITWPDKHSQFLHGSFKPVHDEVVEAVECQVTGKLPDAISGEFMRNGPNPKFMPKGNYHWFEGDGMVHAVRITEGKAYYSCRWVRTRKLSLEDKAGGPVSFRMSDMTGRLGLARLIVSMLKKKLGLAPDLQGDLETTTNTSLQYHAGRLLALNEGGLPYALRVLCDGVVETIGRFAYDGKLQTPFTAHPKVDPRTGYLYAIGYQAMKSPALSFHVVSPSGTLERTLEIPVPRPVMMHDFATSESHAVFLDLPMIFDNAQIPKGKLPVVFNKELPARFGVLPLDATDGSTVRWFTLPETVFGFHTSNCWEEREASGEVVKISLVLCEFEDFDMDTMTHVNLPAPFIYEIDLRSALVSKRPAVNLPPGVGMDFPQQRRSLLGQHSRWLYTVANKGLGKIYAVAKIDLDADAPADVPSPEGAQPATGGMIEFGEGRVGGECVFVPRNRGGQGVGDAEDHGFLMTFVLHEEDQTSELVVYDAKSMSPDPVATVRLPRRVPLGFHAFFMGEDELKGQRSA